jgi:DNA-binding transcriptional MocR family regulator
VGAVSADDLILTNGAQEALSLTLSVLARPGETILCEAATFVGAKAAAERLGCRLHGVALDADGLVPDGLDRAAAATGARLLYVIPTLQNPTGVVVSEARRREILAVARRRGLTVIEDDVYSVYADPEGKPPQLRTLDPERVWFIASASKSISPGLRVGFLAPPGRDAREAALRAARAAHYATPALPSLIVAQWIEDGTADAIADALIAETKERAALARAIFGLPAPTPARPAGQHLWLPMSELDAERVAGRALRAGVEVTPPSAPIVAPELASGLRICLGATPDLGTLERGLQVVADAIAPGPENAALSVL